MHALVRVHALLCDLLITPLLPPTPHIPAWPPQPAASSSGRASGADVGVPRGGRTSAPIATPASSRSSTAPSPSGGGRRPTSPLAYPSLLRKLLVQTEAGAVAELLLADAEWTAAAQAAGWTVANTAVSSRTSVSSFDGDGGATALYAALPEDVAEQLLAAALDKGNVPLALSIFREMDAVRGGAGLAGGGQRMGSGLDGGGLVWPAATIRTTAALILGLCQQLRTAEAMDVVAGIQKQGLPRNEDVGFGKVITVPLAPDRPLAVVQPQVGCAL